MKKRSKVIWLAGLALVSVGAVLVLRAKGAEQCPIEMPARYELVTYYPGETSGDLAYRIKKFPATATFHFHPGTAKFWMFEAPGSVQDGAKSLQEHLQKGGFWQKRAYTTGAVGLVSNYSSGSLMIYPVPSLDKGAPPRHRVQIRGKMHLSGWYENMLSKLPDGILKMFRSKQPARPIVISGIK